MNDMIFLVDDKEHLIAMAWRLSLDPRCDEWRVDLIIGGQSFIVPDGGRAKTIMDCLQRGMSTTSDYDASREDPETGEPVPGYVDGFSAGTPMAERVTRAAATSGV